MMVQKSVEATCVPMMNGFTQFTKKFPYGKKTHGEVSLQRSVFTAKCP